MVLLTLKKKSLFTGRITEGVINRASICCSASHNKLTTAQGRLKPRDQNAGSPMGG